MNEVLSTCRTLIVIPAKAGIHGWAGQGFDMDPRFRGGDEFPYLRAIAPVPVGL
jgi:hypothetical protein